MIKYIVFIVTWTIGVIIIGDLRIVWGVTFMILAHSLRELFKED